MGERNGLAAMALLADHVPFRFCQHMAGKTLRKSAVDLVTKKRTTITEAMRISNEFEE